MNNAKKQSDRILEKPDYVIVGAGSAGCVLAARLSENPKTKVLLLEAGPRDSSPLIHIPLTAGKIFAEKLFDWGFTSEAEPALNHRRLATLRGKILGGCSSVNYMAYTRGDRVDYDNWERQGLPGWGWDGVLPYFKKAESFEGGKNSFRGGNGPLGVQHSRYRDPLTHALIAATEAAGIPRNADSASGDSEGIGPSQYTIRNGRRSSAATAYLKPARNRPNLKVLTDASVIRLVLDGRQAQGVVMRRGGLETEITPSREVILSAGVYKTPQLLMLAGIGRPNQLSAQGIASIVDLPVGENLQDHWAVATLYSRPCPGRFHGQMRVDRMFLNLAMAQLLRVGPATTIPSTVVGFTRNDRHAMAPDLELMYFPLPPPLAHTWFPGWKRAYQDGFGIRPALLHPFSRGSVSLPSVDAEAAPIIRFNGFSDARDMALMVQAVKLARNIAFSTPLDPFRSRELRPGPDVVANDDIEAFIRETAETVSHPCGTCPMGSQGVLDVNLNVRGIGRLRVVDASAMPSIVSGHINACVIMMAEKAADIIRSAA